MFKKNVPAAFLRPLVVAASSVERSFELGGIDPAANFAGACLKLNFKRKKLKIFKRNYFYKTVRIGYDFDEFEQIIICQKLIDYFS